MTTKQLKVPPMSSHKSRVVPRIIKEPSNQKEKASRRLSPLSWGRQKPDRPNKDS